MTVLDRRTLGRVRVWAGAKRRSAQDVGHYLVSLTGWMKTAVEVPPESPIGWRETLARIESHYQLRARNPKAWHEPDVRRDARRIAALSGGTNWQLEREAPIQVTVSAASDIRCALATIEAFRSWPAWRSAPIVLDFTGGERGPHWRILTSIPGVLVGSGATPGESVRVVAVAGSLPTPIPQRRLARGRGDGGSGGGRLLILVQSLPDLTRSSSGQDVYWFARHAAALGYEPLVVPMRPRPEDDAGRWALREVGVKVVSRRLTTEALQRALPGTLAAADVVAVFDKDLVVPARRMLEGRGARVPIVFLPLDLKRFPMQAILDADLGPELAEFGFAIPTEDHVARLTASENAAIEASDLTAVISSEELEAIRGDWPTSKVTQLPMLRSAPLWVAETTDEPRVVFVGGFNHPPNYVAVNWFLCNVWPLVVARRPGTQCEIYGADLRREWRERWVEIPGVIVRGSYEDDETPYRGDVVAVAPLRYGGGTKGKVVGAIGHGAVVVGTRFASQGLPEDMKSAITEASTADDFAEALVALLASPRERERLRRIGRAAYEQTFALGAGKEHVRRCLERLSNDA